MNHNILLNPYVSFMDLLVLTTFKEKVSNSNNTTFFQEKQNRFNAMPHLPVEVIAIVCI